MTGKRARDTADWKIKTLYICLLNPMVVNRMSAQARALSAHVGGVSSEAKAGPRHERQNYSALPLIDSAGDYANSRTAALPNHRGSSSDRHEMSPRRQEKKRRGGGAEVT